MILASDWSIGKLHAEMSPDEGRSFAECIFGSLELVLSIEVIIAALSADGRALYCRVRSRNSLAFAGAASQR